jgi:methyltransferase (TIGR00027 family)
LVTVMRPGKESRTAIATATARAAHLHIADVHIHIDDFAHKLVGISDPGELRDAIRGWNTPSAARVCAYFALRHRFAEDRLEMAIERVVKQIVLLGAGLDSLALRRPALAKDVTLVEVDHPESQRWKLARLRELGLQTPGVIYVPVDFTSEVLEERLAASRVMLDQPTYFSWLGVTQYIERADADATLSFIASQPAWSEVVFDFIVADTLLDPIERAFSDAAARSSALRGEPWLSYYNPTQLETHLADLGFTEVERLTPRLAASRYYSGQPAEVTPLEAWQMVYATV